MKSLAQRMKENYEIRDRHYLTRRTPVIVRVDGRAFHTLTKRFAKPFDQTFIDAMTRAASDLFLEMQGCKMAYIQSDEASFVLTDYDRHATEGWYNYRQSKIESISASQMSVFFNAHMHEMGEGVLTAAFDSRAFNIPEDEVANYFLWRAQDWHRNSVSMYAQAHFSHKQLHGKSIPDMHEMLHKIGRNWATDLSPQHKNGTYLRKFSDRYMTGWTVLPTYESISEAWDSVRPHEETEFQQELMGEPWQSPKLN
jgi:tRNA(His) 5'-end guanylyltransferase